MIKRIRNQYLSFLKKLQFKRRPCIRYHSTINSGFSISEQIQISTLVQGEKAKDDIIEKIEYADSLGVDTIIVGRGGGSIEDYGI